MDYDKDYSLKMYKAMNIRHLMNEKEFQEKLKEAEINKKYFF